MLLCRTISTKTFFVRCAKEDEANLLKASARLFLDLQICVIEKLWKSFRNSLTLARYLIINSSLASYIPFTCQADWKMFGPLGVGTLLRHSLGQTAFSQKGSMLGSQRRFSLLASSALMKLWVWVNKSSKDVGGLAIKSLNNRLVSGDFQSVWHVVIPYTVSEGRCHEVSCVLIGFLEHKRMLINSTFCVTFPFSLVASNGVVASGSTSSFSTKVFPKVLLGCASSESEFHGSIYEFPLVGIERCDTSFRAWVNAVYMAFTRSKFCTINYKTGSLGFGSEVAFKGSPGVCIWCNDGHDIRMARDVSFFFDGRMEWFISGGHFRFTCGGARAVCLKENKKENVRVPQMAPIDDT
ncbi:hypothetical protein Tco_1335545 [Tanacetum coccineum]